MQSDGCMPNLTDHSSSFHFDVGLAHAVILWFFMPFIASASMESSVKDWTREVRRMRSSLGSRVFRGPASTASLSDRVHTVGTLTNLGGPMDSAYFFTDPAGRQGDRSSGRQLRPTCQSRASEPPGARTPW